MSRNIVTDEGRLLQVRDYFLGQPAFAFDTETMGANRGVPHLNTVSWLSLSTRGMTVSIPMGHPRGEITGYEKETAYYTTGGTYNKTVAVFSPPPAQLGPGIVWEILEPLFFSPDIIKIAHNAGFDLATVAKYYGRVPCAPYDDTIIMSWLLNENRKRQGLKYLVRDRYKFNYDDEDVGRCVEKHPFSRVAHYAYCDALWCWLLWQDMYPLLEAEGLEDLHDLEMQVLNTLVGMRLSGVRVDEPVLTRMRHDLGVKVEEVKGRLYLAAGKKFNVNSNPQKQHLLFDPREDGGQGLRPWKLTKGGRKKKEAGGKPEISWFSTDGEVLKTYPGNTVASTLLEYQETNKILGTYVIGYLGDEENDKPRRIFDEHIYADLVQYGTATGRFSCREPNLQNIPRPDTDLGKLVRGIFIADPGHKLVVADFGQIELVVLAHYLGRGHLFEGFLQGIDPHRMTAAMVLKKDPADVTKDERQKYGKTLGFAVVYGAGKGKVASMMEASIGEACRVLEIHREQFPEIYKFRAAVLRKARQQGYVETLLGRRRRLPAIHSSDDGLRMYTERQAFNAVIQGGAADLQKLAMVRCDADPRMGADIDLILSVHDEIVLSAPEERAGEAAVILEEAMTGHGIQRLLNVPLKVDVNIVNRWSEAK